MMDYKNNAKLILLPMSLPSNPSPTWILYSTEGCHLCDDAIELLEQLQSVYDVAYHVIDIMDLPDATMQAFATRIPVLMVDKQEIDYPFSLLDLVRLTQTHD